MDYKKIAIVLFLSSVFISIIVFIVYFDIIIKSYGIIISMLFSLITFGMIVFKSQKCDDGQREEAVTYDDVKEELKEKSSYEEFLGILGQEKTDDNILKLLVAQYEAGIGLYFKKQENAIFKCVSRFAIPENEDCIGEFQENSLNSQVIKDQKVMILREIPENYMIIYSGLGKSLPKFLVIIPLLKNKNVIGLIELALFNLSKNNEDILNKISKNLMSDIN